MNTKSLIGKLSHQFPRRLSLKYNDHVGLMTSKFKPETNKIVVCLDFDEDILEQTIAFKPDLIITHHPFIYGSKAKVLKNDEKKAKLYNKIEKLGYPIFSMHTNFDEGKGGMNDALAKALDLIDVYTPIDTPILRIGYLKEEMDITEFAKYAKKKLNVSYGLLIDKGNPTIKKVGIIGGGGGGWYKFAKDEGCDIYISGDAPHHVRRSIVTDKYNYLDLPHEIEKIFIPTIKELLLSYDNTLEILTIDHEKEPKVI